MPVKPARPFRGMHGPLGHRVLHVDSVVDLVHAAGARWQEALPDIILPQVGKPGTIMRILQ